MSFANIYKFLSCFCIPKVDTDLKKDVQDVQLTVQDVKTTISDIKNSQ